MNNLSWNQIQANTGDPNSSMNNAISGLSQAGTIFGSLRKSILDEEQNKINNQFRDKQLDEQVNQFAQTFGLQKDTLLETIRSNRETEKIKQQEANTHEYQAREQASIGHQNANTNLFDAQQRANIGYQNAETNRINTESNIGLNNKRIEEIGLRIEGLNIDNKKKEALSNAHIYVANLPDTVVALREKQKTKPNEWTKEDNAELIRQENDLKKTTSANGIISVLERQVGRSGYNLDKKDLGVLNDEAVAESNAMNELLKNENRLKSDSTIGYNQVVDEVNTSKLIKDDKELLLLSISKAQEIYPTMKKAHIMSLFSKKGDSHYFKGNTLTDEQRKNLTDFIANPKNYENNFVADVAIKAGKEKDVLEKRTSLDNITQNKQPISTTRSINGLNTESIPTPEYDYLTPNNILLQSLKTLNDAKTVRTLSIKQAYERINPKNIELNTTSNDKYNKKYNELSKQQKETINKIVNYKIKNDIETLLDNDSKLNLIKEGINANPSNRRTISSLTPIFNPFGI